MWLLENQEAFEGNRILATEKHLRAQALTSYPRPTIMATARQDLSVWKNSS